MSWLGTLTAGLFAWLTFTIIAEPAHCEDTAVAKQRPNIVWIIAAAASPHLSCYGETAIATPVLDQMAEEGVRFDSAFTTSPAASTSRSALVSGMYATTLGAHNHPSQNREGPAAGNEAYYDSYVLPQEIKLVPQLLKESGYYTSLGDFGDGSKVGRTDYNFVWDRALYDSGDWRKHLKGQPFFAQIMLRGGDDRDAKKWATDPSTIELPHHYPDHDEFRADWANYLNSWRQTDVEVGEVLKQLTKAGVADNTVVFFLTDHGVHHLRGAHYLYDAGTRIPLIVRFPDGSNSGVVRDDLVEHIDVSATTLALAGLAIPGYMHGRDLFARKLLPREYVFASRDRCEETVDVVRSVRNKRYKYIRNFFPHLQHLEPNQTRDRKQVVKLLRFMDESKLLDSEYAALLRSRKPLEELYDLRVDPLETQNLIRHVQYKVLSIEFRKVLKNWMIKTGDLGMIPEPILEELGKEYGNKYYVRQQDAFKDIGRSVLGITQAGDREAGRHIESYMQSPVPSIRYWALTELGTLPPGPSAESLLLGLVDSSEAVRIAAALAICKHDNGNVDRAVEVISHELNDENVLVGLYAMRALERIGPDATLYLQAIEAAQNGPYEFTRRIARRVHAKLTISGND